MRYYFGDYTLDPAACMLMRLGESADVPRRVFDCIFYLLENRDRAIGRDELIQKLWGRSNVSDNQLAQVVLAARRLLKDDGGSGQRWIRTVPGIGYHWAGPVIEAEERGTAPAQPVIDSPLLQEPAIVEVPAPETVTLAAADPAPQSTSERGPSTASWSGRGQLLASALLALPLLGAGALGLLGQTERGSVSAASDAVDAAAPVEPLSHLRSELRLARYEQVRERIASMPAELADSPDVRILEIQLDVGRGRFARAEEKLTAQMRRAEAAGDPVWRAQLLTLRSILNYRIQKPGVEILTPAQKALDLLRAEQTAGRAVPTKLLAEALRVRGNGLVSTDQLELAMLDMVYALDLYQGIGDAERTADLRVSLARVWMRVGRLTEALEQITEVADSYRELGDPIREIFAWNTATKIQIELLRWREALASSDRSMQLLLEAPYTERRYPTLQLRALVLTGLGRLREAASLLEEADAKGERHDNVIPAIYHLAAGNYHSALAAASDELLNNELNTRSNLILDNRDGAMLLWMAAAQNIAGNGQPMPTLPPGQQAILDRPESAPARIARGRWLWSKGQLDEAAAELRLALAEARQDRQLFRMLLASDPLVDLLIERGDLAGAERVLAELRTHDPLRIERDYEANQLILRLALANGERNAIVSAHRRTMALAGERLLPTHIREAYEAAVGLPAVGSGTAHTRNGD